MTLALPAVPAIDGEATTQARGQQGRLTKPTGALGALEDLSVWLAGVQGCCPPVPPERVRVVLFAGDHGIAAAGVSAYPSEVTAQMVANFLAGGAGVNVLARAVGAGVRVVDMAVASAIPGPVPDDVSAWKVRAGCDRLDEGDALTADEVERAVSAGMALADAEIDAGADLLVPGDMGIGNTTPAAVLIAALTNHAADAVTGRGTGVDDAALARKRDVVAATLRRIGERREPLDLLAATGGADIAAMAGFLAQAAIRRTPVLLDGIVSGAAALVAERLAPGAKAWWAAGHRSAEPAHDLALRALGLRPCLDLGLRLGEGTGALLAVPILRAAALTLAQMATFEQAGVSDRA